MDSYSDLLKLTNQTENSYWYKKSVPENTTLLYEGDVADKIYFIKKGALRLWNNDDGKDITFQFFFEGQIAGRQVRGQHREYARTRGTGPVSYTHLHPPLL